MRVPEQLDQALLGGAGALQAGLQVHVLVADFLVGAILFFDVAQLADVGEECVELLRRDAQRRRKFAGVAGLRFGVQLFHVAAVSCSQLFDRGAGFVVVCGQDIQRGRLHDHRADGFGGF